MKIKIFIALFGLSFFQLFGAAESVLHESAAASLAVKADQEAVDNALNGLKKICISIIDLKKVVSGEMNSSDMDFVSVAENAIQSSKEIIDILLTKNLIDIKQADDLSFPDYYKIIQRLANMPADASGKANALIGSLKTLRFNLTRHILEQIKLKKPEIRINIPAECQEI